MKTLTLLSVFAVAHLLACTQPIETTDSPAEVSGLFVDVRIPGPLTPIERGNKYQIPLDETLMRTQLGEITGGGTQLGQVKPDGTHDIVFAALDVELNDAGGLTVLRSELMRLGAPRGTTLHYELDGKSVVEPLWK